MSNQEKDFSRSAGKWMIVLSWVSAIALLTLLFTNILDKKYNPNQNVSTHVFEDGSKEVILQSSRHGHYVAAGRINSHPVVFLVDTGASYVSVPEDVANKAGLKKGRPYTVTTANGDIIVYATVLDEISIGDIVLYDVRADINPHIDAQEILLGMSFLRNLTVTHEDGTLTIRQ